ncbi:FAD-dependent oxidoreductase [Prosthecobacter sp. SYSU 5D2]|uniref:NAD(P)/FAD-dependent oxidoreductase n=1 Tax=Prosthecobacter sp. SYSU 5D2 TaxID=3134134 RepID=UPI0031FE56A9
MQKIAIIGAGLAGIASARNLSQQGNQVTVFEKSRGFGGRCATKRWMGCRVDHGAQYFTMRDAAFRQTVTEGCGDALRTIPAPVHHLENGQTSTTERFYHLQGNSHLCRDLATGLDIRFEQTVEAVLPAERGWQVQGELFNQVVSTAPLPQTMRIFGQPAVPDSYIPCLAMVALYRGDHLGMTGEYYDITGRPADDLAWSACENHKEGRIIEGCTVMVAHASEAFSREHLEQPPETWSEWLKGQLEALWELPKNQFEAHVTHRWRYARVAEAVKIPSLPRGLHFCGDALEASRVEAAWLQGARLAQNFPPAP